MDQIVNGLETHFMTALWVSAALALLITGAVALVWWRGRRWVDRSRTSLATARHTTLFSQSDPLPPRPGGPAGEPAPTPSGGSTSGGSRSGDQSPSAGELGSRLVREAAVRAAALRDAWDRSYREARGSEAPPSAAAGPTGDISDRMDELLREQRETNALLRQLLDRLAKSDR